MFFWRAENLEWKSGDKYNYRKEIRMASPDFREVIVFL